MLNYYSVAIEAYSNNGVALTYSSSSVVNTATSITLNQVTTNNFGSNMGYSNGAVAQTLHFLPTGASYFTYLGSKCLSAAYIVRTTTTFVQFAHTYTVGTIEY